MMPGLVTLLFLLLALVGVIESRPLVLVLATAAVLLQSLELPT